MITNPVASGISALVANVFSALQTFTGSISAPAVLTTNIAEVTYLVATAPPAVTNFYLSNGGIQYYTVATTANFTLNIALSSSATLNSSLAIGNSIALTLEILNGATAYMPTAFQIDGVAFTPKWANASAPTSGNASAIDTYTFVIQKTTASTYTVLGSQVNYA